MTAPTPGPWKIVYEGDGLGARPAIVRGPCLQVIVDHREDFGDPLPDARLIAAAPDLLMWSRRFFAAHDGTAGLTPEEVAAWREVVRKVKG